MDSVAPVLYESSALRAGGKRQLSYFIGYRADSSGGPVTINHGSTPLAGEIVLDAQAASSLV